MEKRPQSSDFDANHVLSVFRAEQLIEQGRYEEGNDLLKSAEGHPNVDQVTLCLRLAEYYIESNDRERGIAYLTRLCTQTVDNYEKAIENRGLTKVWLKYCSLVEGEVPRTVYFSSSPAPLAPEACSMPINEIMALPDDELLTALSDHLAELSGEGEALEALSEPERMVYDADLMMSEVNSGGFGHYLYYHGDRLGALERALGTIGADKCVTLLGRVKGKFPRSTPPKRLDTMQSRLDKMEEKGIDFEDEDEYYYEITERELIGCLCVFVRANQAAFR